MPKRYVILNLHGVGEPQRVLEPGEAPYWLSVDQFRETVDLAASLRGRHDCEFTIDDSNLSDATIAGPYLAQRGFTTRIFVLTGRMGKKGSLDHQALSDLIAMGHAIGSHGHAHRDWKQVPDAELASEITVPRQQLQDLTGQPIDAAGLPFGGYNRKVLAQARRAGFRRLYSSDGGLADDKAWPTARTSLRCDMSQDQIRAILCGDEPLSKRLARRLKGEIKKRM